MVVVDSSSIKNDHVHATTLQGQENLQVITIYVQRGCVSGLAGLVPGQTGIVANVLFRQRLDGQRADPPSSFRHENVCQVARRLTVERPREFAGNVAGRDGALYGNRFTCLGDVVTERKRRHLRRDLKPEIYRSKS